MNVKQYYNAKHLKWVFWLVVTIWWIGIVIRARINGTMYWGEMVKETGELTWYLLLFTIFISLLHKLFPRVWQIGNIVDLRKYTGICCWLIALTHAGSEMLGRGILGNVDAMVRTAFSMEYGMAFGASAFLIMLPLFLTSTNYAVSVMGYVWWKRLHRLTHVAFVLAGVHILLAKYASTGELYLRTVGALTLYVVGYAIVFFKRYRKHRTAKNTAPVENTVDTPAKISNIEP